MFHELSKVEYGLSDLWDVLQCESLLEAGDQVLLVDRSKFKPAGDKCSIKQFPITIVSAGKIACNTIKVELQKTEYVYIK